jgi:hypothetical protein
VALRSSGVNLVLADTLDPESLLIAADQFGFLVLRRLDADLPPSSDSLQTAGGHPSFLGWVVRQEDAPELLPQLSKAAVGLVGLEVTQHDVSLDVAVDFLVCPGGLVPALHEVALPKLILGHRSEEAGRAGVIGGVMPG